MKADLIFALENAGWPALLVDESCAIRRANQAAVAAFGSILEGSSALLASIWSPENEPTPEQFLVQWERAPTPVVLIKLRVKGGATISFKCYLSASSRDQQKFYSFQLFRDSPASPAEGNVPPPDSNLAAPVAGREKLPGAIGAKPKSELHSVEAGLAQKQKLECAMQLTRTVALDFNNALTSILGHTSLVLSKMEKNNPWRNSLIEVEKSAEKAAEIAHDLAAFSLQEKDARAHLAGNLNDLLRRTVELFQAPNVPGNITWTMQLESQLYSVNFDEAKMQQAFAKILDNATQAVGPEGRITVHTHNRDVAEPHQDGTAQLSPGSYVCLEISDNGSGIGPDIMPRIFEPFFTTKPKHRGLGLAWVYGIITNHGGSVAVTSQPKQGTIVRVYLPAQKKIVKDTEIKDDELQGNQTILMVDDEDLLLTMAEMILPSFGYRVLTANSGQKALEVFSKNAEQIDLVITDLVMPNMSGRELIEHLRRISPSLRIMCTSGYVRSANKKEEERYLQKPFTSQELLRKVKDALS